MTTPQRDMTECLRREHAKLDAEAAARDTMGAGWIEPETDDRWTIMPMVFILAVGCGVYGAIRLGGDLMALWLGVPL